MMESSESLPPVRKSENVAMRVINFLSGLGLATILLLLLGILTWLATLEQIDNGLYPTLNKYFDWKAWYVLPEISTMPKINGNALTFPLPGGYWVCALLLLNLTLGGLIRVRKGKKQIGVLISHFGIIFMLAGGGVAHHFSERGNMRIDPDGMSNVAQDYFEYVIEAAEVKEAKQESIHVIRGKYLTDLEGGASRVFKLPKMPFDLEVAGYMKNAAPVPAMQQAPQRGERIVDGYYLAEAPDRENGKAIEQEAKMAGCYVRALFRDGTKSDPFILSGAAFYPFSVRVDDRIFTVDMRKRLWPMPFSIKLDQFTAEFHPGTQRPKKFVSDITRIENGSEAKVTVQMNEPMRYEGLTFFQASYGPPGAGPNDKLYTVFEVVKNPADKWPEYSLYVVSFGLLVHFIMKLLAYLNGSARKKRDV